MKKVTTLKLVLGLLVAFGLIIANFSFNASNVKATDKIYNVSIYTYDTTASLNWYTDAPYLGEINYGQYDYNHKITKSVATDWHSYELTGLIPGTAYNYRLIAKDNKGNELARYEGTLETSGAKPTSQLFWQFFNLNFDKNLYSPSGKYPSEILNPNYLSLGTPAVGGNSLKVINPDSHLIYSAEHALEGSSGTMLVMLRFDNFNKNMTVWQTNDSRYGLYFEHTASYNRLVARAGYDSKRTEKQEAYYYLDTKNVWKAGEWHQVGMTWEGNLGGTVKIYVDGEVKDEARFTNGSGVSTFMVGNNYAHTQNFSNGQIDDFKLFKWASDSTSMRNESNRYAFLNKNKGQVAGVQVRNIKMGKLIKTATDAKVYLVGRDMTKIYVANEDALKRLGHLGRIVIATTEELNQYANAGTFYSWSKYPDASLLKGADNTIYWVWNGEKRAIANETVFNNYNNNWSDVINISNDELNTYPTGVTYYK
ncbi:MAG TPA: hypothetical protein PKZ16_03010 [bacterium]|nr:hypothetical protein [bacterium]HPL95657.1 hypothetical protein [bacterium]